jgi:hypothetical protein
MKRGGPGAAAQATHDVGRNEATPEQNQLHRTRRLFLVFIADVGG